MILDLASVTNNIYQMLIEDLSCEMNLHDVITVFFLPLGFLWHNVETLLWDSSAEGHCCNSLHLLNHTGHISLVTFLVLILACICITVQTCNIHFNPRGFLNIVLQA